MTKHLPPKGQSLIAKHKASESCPCNPEKIVKTIGRASGRGGSHQGYRTEVSFQHKILVTEEV